MKKKKLNLFLNIVTICLCLCAIAIGVYSVKNASLNVTGTIGFTANNCKFTLSSVVNCASTTGSDAEIKDFEAVTNSFEAKTSETLTHSLGALNFNDVVTGGNVVKITLTFTNDSNFDIKIAMTDNVKFVANGSTAATGTEKIISEVKQGDNILTKGSGEVILDTSSNKTADIVVTLTIAESDLDSLTALTGKLQLSFSVGQYVVEPLVFNVKVGEFYYDSAAIAGSSTALSAADLTTTAKRNYVEMGSYNGTALKWYLFAQKGANGMQAVTSPLVNDDSPLPSGTYYFISEYALNKSTKAFDSVNYSNTYEGSTIQKYLTDETSVSDTFYKDYNIDTNNDILKAIGNGRKIEDAGNSSYKEGSCITASLQKLWLLSEDELDLLNGGNEVKSLYENNNTSIYYKNIMALGIQSNSSVWWWLRTPCTTNSHIPFYSYHNGAVGHSDAGDYGAVRPAFQITI